MYIKGVVVRKEYKSEWNAWNNAKRRCSVKSHPSYKFYGARGIAMCNRWKKSFICFLNDVGKKPKESLTLDRIDNNKGYEPGNCRWVSMKIQCNNRRKRTGYFKKAKKYSCLGMEKTVKEWNTFLKYKGNTLCINMKNKKISMENAIIYRLDKMSKIN